MDYLYGALNTRVVKVEYEGKNTGPTVNVTVDNEDCTISADVKPLSLSPSYIKANIPSQEGNYFMMLQKTPGDTIFNYSKDLPEEVVNNIVNVNKLQDLLQAGDNISITPQESGKLEIAANINTTATARFSESTLPSVLTGNDTTQLLKSNIIGSDIEVEQGDVVIFPDRDKLVVFIGTVTDKDETQITVGNIKYLNNSIIIVKEEWSKGPSNYPQQYPYKGYYWLCQKNDVNEAPVEGENWLSLGPIDNNTTYYSTSEVEDQGGIGTDYTLNFENLQPTSPLPKVNDFVVFSTNTNNYIGQITELPTDSTAKVNVKLQSVKTQTPLITPYLHSIKVTGTSEVGSHNYTLYFNITNKRATPYNDIATLGGDIELGFIYPATGARDTDKEIVTGIQVREGGVQLALTTVDFSDSIIINNLVTLTSVSISDKVK